MRHRLLALGLLGIGLGLGFPAFGVSAAPGSFFHFLTPSLPASARRTLAQFPAFEAGPARGPVVDILFMPGCPHCRTLWQRIELLKAINPRASQLRYRWIPVTLNAQQAAMLLPYWKGERNGRALATFMHTEFSARSEMLTPADNAEVSRIQAATAPALKWLRHTGAQDVPAVIGPRGERPVLHLGDPNPVRLERWLGLAGAG